MTVLSIVPLDYLLSWLISLVSLTSEFDTNRASGEKSEKKAYRTDESTQDQMNSVIVVGTNKTLPL